eukprot:gene15361-12408_t
MACIGCDSILFQTCLNIINHVRQLRHAQRIITVGRGRYEVTWKVDRSMVDPLLKGTAGEDDERMTIIESGENHIQKDRTKMNSRMIDDAQLFSVQYSVVNGTLVYRFTYDGYIPDDDDYSGYDYGDD